MAKRTVTSKGLRVKVRALNKANETLGADLKACRIQIRQLTDALLLAKSQRDTAQARLIENDLDFSTDSVQVDEIIARAKETGRGQSDRNTEGTQ